MKHGIRKTLNGVDLFCIASGAMISSGIFVLPGIAFAAIGPAVFISYGIAGFAALLGALAIIELSTAMPRAGGDYYFIERSLGPGVGTVAGILSYLALVLKTSFAAFGLGAVLSDWFFSSPAHAVPIAAAATVIFVMVNLAGTREAAFAEVLMVMGLLALLTGYIVFEVPKIQPVRFQPFFLSGKSPGALFSVAALVFVSFGGLLKVSSVSEEVMVPRRNIPAGILSSIVVVTMLYVLILVVTVGALPPEILAGSLTPLADAARMHYGRIGYWLISAAALLAFVTTVNAGIMAASRYPVAMGRDRLLPLWFSASIGGSQTPVFAILATGALMLVALKLPLELLVKAASAVIMASYVLINAAVIILRESRLQNYRPTFRSPLYPGLQIASIVGFTALIVNMGAAVILMCLGAVAAALLLFFCFGRGGRREFALLHLLERVTNRSLTGNALEHELREVIRNRDDMVPDEFDHLVETSQARIYSGPMSAGELLRRVSGEFSGEVGVEPAEMLRLLEEREAESSTVIAPGTALPHLILPGENRFALFIAKVDGGAGFAEDEKPVSAVFVLAGSRDRRNFHLKALAAIAQIISDPGFDATWAGLSTPEQLRNALLLGRRRRHGHK